MHPILPSHGPERTAPSVCCHVWKGTQSEGEGQDTYHGGQTGKYRRLDGFLCYVRDGLIPSVEGVGNDELDASHLDPPNEGLRQRYTVRRCCIFEGKIHA